jgi:hypothetical protein
MRHCMFDSAYLTLLSTAPTDLVNAMEPSFPHFSDGPSSPKPFALAAYVYLICNAPVCGNFFSLAVSAIDCAAISYREAIAG